MTILLRTVAAATLACVAAVAAAMPAAARDNLHTGDVADPFYTPPALLPDAPGTVIRSERATRVLDPGGASEVSVAARRILYTSRNASGEPIAVSGIVMRPTTPWRGPGPRPLVVHAPGTHGMTDACAPTRSMRSGLDYEEVLTAGLIARGYAVVQTDYEGLGTPGVHTYMIRRAQAHAVLDSARAARSLDGWGLDASPMALSGYSQGGGAAAAAAELAAEYAPELSFVGAAIGAPPADLVANARHLERSWNFAFLGYSLRALIAEYDIDPDSILNRRGRQLMNELSDSCVLHRSRFAFRSSSWYLKGGITVAELASSEPFATMVAEQRLGTVAPGMPTLVSHARHDNIVPFAAGTTMVDGWCRAGASVEFRVNGHISHEVAILPFLREAGEFLAERFAGRAPVSTCR